MKPFLVFRGPQTVIWNYRPVGKKCFRINMWVHMPFRAEPDVNDIRIKESLTLAELKPIMDLYANEMMDLAQMDLYQHWAKFLLSITNETTDEQIDAFHDNFPPLKYGYECFVWG